jgi:hypothetical protein
VNPGLLLRETGGFENKIVCPLAKNIKNTIKDHPEWYFYLRTEVCPEILIAPSISHPDLQQVHTNEQMPLSKEFWKAAFQFIQSVYTDHHVLPMFVTLNHGAWLTSVARNHIGLVRSSHAHAHLFYARDAAEMVPMLGGRTRAHEFYRTENVRHATSLVDRRQNKALWDAITTLSDRVDNLSRKIDDLSTELRRIFGKPTLGPEVIEGQSAGSTSTSTQKRKREM